MTDYEFGYIMMKLCNVAQVRKIVLKSAKLTGRLCNAAHGFADAVDCKPTKSGADKAFLVKLEKELSQKRITEEKKG